MRAAQIARPGGDFEIVEREIPRPPLVTQRVMSRKARSRVVLIMGRDFGGVLQLAGTTGFKTKDFSIPRSSFAMHTLSGDRTYSPNGAIREKPACW